MIKVFKDDRTMRALVLIFIIWCTLAALIVAASRYENSDTHKRLIQGIHG